MKYLFQSEHMSKHEISFNTRLSDQVRTQADFTYKISPTVISITDTGLGKCSVTEDIEAVLHKIEDWHQGSIRSFKIMSRDGKGFWHEVRWDGKNASFLALEETDERKACKKLLVSRNKKSVRLSSTRRFLKSIPTEHVILDGEIAALDEKARSSFQLYLADNRSRVRAFQGGSNCERRLSGHLDSHAFGYSLI
jgi:hypothetical protein